MGENNREYALSIRQALKAAVKQAQDNPVNIHIPSAGQRGAVIGIINRIAGGDDNRKLLLGWLFANEGEIFDRVSTKSLNDEQWAALYAWCDFRKDEEELVWKPKDTFKQECLAVLSAAMNEYFDVKYTEHDGLPEPPDIVATAVRLGGEITQTGVKTAGIKGVEDSVFKQEKNKPDIKSPDYPYVSAEAVGREDTRTIIEDYETEKETKTAALKPVMKSRPKLINPFD